NDHPVLVALLLVKRVSDGGAYVIQHDQRISMASNETLPMSLPGGRFLIEIKLSNNVRRNPRCGILLTIRSTKRPFVQLAFVAEKYEAINNFVTELPVKRDCRVVRAYGFQCGELNPKLLIKAGRRTHQRFAHAAPAKLWTNSRPAVPGHSWHSISSDSIEKKTRRRSVAKRHQRKLG